MRHGSLERDVLRDPGHAGDAAMVRLRALQRGPRLPDPVHGPPGRDEHVPGAEEPGGAWLRPGQGRDLRAPDTHRVLDHPGREAGATGVVPAVVGTALPRF